jgi:hypothetical protein
MACCRRLECSSTAPSTRHQGTSTKIVCTALGKEEAMHLEVRSYSQSCWGVAFMAAVCTTSASLLAQSFTTDQGRAVVFMLVS